MRAALAISLVLLCSGLTACAGDSGRLYEGPARDRSEVAILDREIRDKLRVLRIDEYETHGTHWELLPGDHEVEIEAWQTRGGTDHLSATITCHAVFTARAGARYSIRMEQMIERLRGGAFRGNIDIWIEDATEPDVHIDETTCGNLRGSAM